MLLHVTDRLKVRAFERNHNSFDLYGGKSITPKLDAVAEGGPFIIKKDLHAHDVSSFLLIVEAIDPIEAAAVQKKYLSS